MSRYIDHARRELMAVGYDVDSTEDGPNEWVRDNLYSLLEVFASQGHSGSSAPYVANAFKKLALFEPLCPLKGTDDEWNEVGNGMYQNNRCSHVFKDETGTYDSNGRVFRGPSGSCFTNIDSRVYITFPYTPTTEYVDVPQ